MWKFCGDLSPSILSTPSASPTTDEIVAVSAGFDRHPEDGGGLLATEDYRAIGESVKEHARLRGQGRRFGVLEGGYHHAVLGSHVESFLEGWTSLGSIGTHGRKLAEALGRASDVDRDA